MTAHAPIWQLTTSKKQQLIEKFSDCVMVRETVDRRVWAICEFRGVDIESFCVICRHKIRERVRWQSGFTRESTSRGCTKLGTSPGGLPHR